MDEPRYLAIDLNGGERSGVYEGFLNLKVVCLGEGHAELAEKIAAWMNEETTKEDKDNANLPCGTLLAPS